jgi:hypothetical protein
MVLRTVYTEVAERAMQLYYDGLGEKDRRQYAAVEAIKLGHGGVTYISRLLCLDRSTVIQGKKELLAPAVDEPIARGRQRRTGGGRKKKDGSA